MEMQGLTVKRDNPNLQRHMVCFHLFIVSLCDAFETTTEANLFSSSEDAIAGLVNKIYNAVLSLYFYRLVEGI